MLVSFCPRGKHGSRKKALMLCFVLEPVELHDLLLYRNEHRCMWIDSISLHSDRLLPVFLVWINIWPSYLSKTMLE